MYLGSTTLTLVIAALAVFGVVRLVLAAIQHDSSSWEDGYEPSDPHPDAAAHRVRQTPRHQSTGRARRKRLAQGNSAAA